MKEKLTEPQGEVEIVGKTIIVELSKKVTFNDFEIEKIELDQRCRICCSKQ